MTVYVQDADFTLHHGDVLDVLPTLPDGSVNCCVTSPPFYGLRDYGVDGQIGLEDTPDEWVARLVAVFAECRRVLRDDGTLWVECGDSYCANQAGGTATDGKSGVATIGKASPKHPTKQKDLLGQPWMLAFALRADGWWLRSEIIWARPNPMPESVTDRPTKAHSTVFLLSKRPRYFYDADAIAEPASWERWGDQTTPKYQGTDTTTGWIKPKTRAELVARGGRTTNGQKSRTDERRGFDNRLERVDGMKNARTVWTIPTEGYPEAHFATFPQELARRCILAGCPEGGVVLDPFMGSGTTALVARNHNRRSIGIELNVDYCAMAARRLAQQSLLAGDAA